MFRAGDHDAEPEEVGAARLDRVQQADGTADQQQPAEQEHRGQRGDAGVDQADESGERPGSRRARRASRNRGSASAVSLLGRVHLAMQRLLDPLHPSPLVPVTPVS